MQDNHYSHTWSYRNLFREVLPYVTHHISAHFMKNALTKPDMGFYRPCSVPLDHKVTFPTVLARSLGGWGLTV